MADRKGPWTSVCCWCKRIRTGTVWKEDSEGVCEGNMNLTHGICPDCIRTQFPEIADEAMRDGSVV